ncbi:MAG: OmpW family outer membrane protein [Simkaniaceae bacterium]|nr:OmpW family outer membrane protein [Simkaniaceae bacterium]
MLTKPLSTILQAFLLGAILLSAFQAESKEILLEGKGSYFISKNKLFRDIYGKTGLYRIETNIQTWKDLYTWSSLGYLYARGYSTQKTKTDFQLVPFSVGASYLCKYGNWTPYIGIGPTLAYCYVNNQSNYVTRHQPGWGIGFLTKLGFFAHVHKSVFLDFFADYSFMMAKFRYGEQLTERYKVDLSGYSFGAGLGLRF